MKTVSRGLLCVGMVCWLSGVAWAETSVMPYDSWEYQWGTDHIWTFDPDGHVADGITAAHEDRGLFALPITFDPWTGEHPDEHSTITVRDAEGTVINGKVYWLQTALPVWRPTSSAPALEPGAELTLELSLTQSESAKEAGIQDIERTIPITVSSEPAPAAQPAEITSVAFDLGAGPNHCGWPSVKIAWSHASDLPHWMGPLVNYKIEVSSPHEALSDTGGRRDWTGPFEASLYYDAPLLDQDLCFVIHTLNRPGGMLNNDGTPTGGEDATAVTEQRCVTAAEVAEALDEAGCSIADFIGETDPPTDPTTDVMDDGMDNVSLDDVGPVPDGGQAQTSGSTSSGSGGCASGGGPPPALWLVVLALALCASRRPEDLAPEDAP